MWEVFWSAIAGSGVATGLVSWYFSRKTEEYKSSLERTNKHLQVLLDKSLFVNKLQIEHEYKIYQQVWEKLVDLNTSSLKLITKSETDENIPESEKRQRMLVFNNSARAYYTYIEKNKPFFSKELYFPFMLLTEELYEIADSIPNICETTEPYSWALTIGKREQITKKIEEACEAIRERISQLSA